MTTTRHIATVPGPPRTQAEREAERARHVGPMLTLVKAIIKAVGADDHRPEIETARRYVTSLKAGRPATYPETRVVLVALATVGPGPGAAALLKTLKRKCRGCGYPLTEKQAGPGSGSGACAGCSSVWRAVTGKTRKKVRNQAGEKGADAA